MTNAEIGIPEFTVYKIPKKKPRYIKCDALKQLDKDYQLWWYSTKHIEIKLQIKSKFMDNGANALTKSIVAWLTMHGHFAARVNTQGTYSVAQGRYIKSGSTNGMADINAVVNGRSVSIEVKFGKDKQSDVQKAVQAQITAAGGVYFLARTFDGFLEAIAKYL